MERLTDRTARYLLVTNAALNGPAARLQVDDPVSQRTGPLPPRLARLGNLEGRIAVLAGMDTEKLSCKVKEALTESFRVPHGKWRACRDALRAAVRARMARAQPGTWTRDEIIQTVVRDHDGYFASSPELETFVAPTNWAEIAATLDERRAVVIVGASGTGKSLAARKLVDELRARVPGVERVTVTGGPRDLFADGTSPPVVYEIEDPWGGLAFAPERRDWNRQLPAFLETRLRGDVYVVATSREDVLGSAGDARQRIERWVVRLEPEHYGKTERRRIYAAMAEGLPRGLQGMARRAARDVLSELATPLEIRKFFDAVALRDPETHERELIREAIAKAHLDAIERNVADQIEQRGEVPAAAVVWGLLKVADAVPAAVLKRLEDALYDRHPEMAAGLMPLVLFLVSGHSLRQASNDGRVSYYHPRVEAGIERALHADEQQLVAKRMLRRLAALLASDDAPGAGWEAAASAALIAAVRKVPALAVEPDRQTRSVIDEWLSSRRPVSGSDFQKHLELAAGAGSADCAVAELGRYLVAWQDCSEAWGFAPNAAPPERDGAWFTRWRACSATGPIIERYVEDVLTSDGNCDFDLSFVDAVQRLAPNLSAAFVEAAKRVVGRGVYPPADLIAHGAVRDVNGFEEVVDRAVATVTSDGWTEEAERRHLAIVNGEYSEDYADFIAGDFDEGYTANLFLAAYVERVRSSGDWHRLAAHRHRSHLADDWLLALLRADTARINREEAADAFAAGLKGDAEERAWHLAARTWDERFRGPLGERVYAGDASSDVRRAAFGCLVMRAREMIDPLVVQLRASGEFGRLVEIAHDVAQWLAGKSQSDTEPSDALAREVKGNLPADMASLADASLALRREVGPEVSERALALLASATEGSIDVRRLRVAIDAHAPLDVADDVVWLLDHAEDPSVAVEAMQAAVRRGMTEVVQRALAHRYADVVAIAVSALGMESVAPLSDELLRLAGARGSPIRIALAAVLEAKPHREHLPTLLALLRDKWSRYSGVYGRNDNFPIARAAMAALAALAPLQYEDMKEVFRVAVATSDRTLRAAGFRLFATSDEKRYRLGLFEQALRPGRGEVRVAAVEALRDHDECVDAEMMERVTPEALASQPPAVAAALASFVGARATLNNVLGVGRVLAADGKRKALVLLLIRFVVARSAETGDQLATALGVGHPAVAWALDGQQDNRLPARALDNLGAVDVCEAVYKYLA